MWRTAFCATSDVKKRKTPSAAAPTIGSHSGRVFRFSLPEVFLPIRALRAYFVRLAQGLVPHKLLLVWRTSFCATATTSNVRPRQQWRRSSVPTADASSVPSFPRCSSRIGALRARLVHPTQCLVPHQVLACVAYCILCYQRRQEMKDTVSSGADHRFPQRTRLPFLSSRGAPPEQEPLVLAWFVSHND